MVDGLELLSDSEHPQISVEELIEAEVVVRNNERVQQLAKDVGKCLCSYPITMPELNFTGVLPHQIFCDGWSIGYDDRFPQRRRVQQALTFARFSEHDNLYAHPLVSTLPCPSTVNIILTGINRTLYPFLTPTLKKCCILVNNLWLFSPHF